MTAGLDVFHKIVALSVFLVTIYFVIRPIFIPISLKNRRFRLPINIVTTPIIGILILLATLTLSPRNLLKSFIGDKFVRPWTILIIFNATAYLCLSLELTGCFKYLAIKSTNFAGNSRRSLFIALFFLSSFITVFTSNDIVILSLTPIIILFSRLKGVDPKPYLFGQFLAANIWSTCIYVGNPTNIIVAQAYGVKFVNYSLWLGLPGIVSGLTCLGILLFYFRKDLREPFPVSSIDTSGVDATMVLSHKYFVIGGVAWFSVFIVLLICSSWISKWIELWQIILIFSGGAFIQNLVRDIIFYREHPGTPLIDPAWKRAKEAEENGTPVSAAAHTATATNITSETEMVERFPASTAGSSNEIETSGTPPAAKPGANELLLAPLEESQYYSVLTMLRVPWETVPFVIGTFAMVKAFDQSGWVRLFAIWLSFLSRRMQVYGSIFLWAYVSSFVCSILNNQPTTILFTNILLKRRFSQHVTRRTSAASAMGLILGSNFCGCLTLIGALAGIMWSSILRREKIHISFWQFAKVGFVVMPLVIASGCAMLCLEHAVYPDSLLKTF